MKITQVVLKNFRAYRQETVITFEDLTVLIGKNDIGKSTVRESVRQGYKTVALVRNLDKVRSESGQRLYSDFFHGAQVVECDVTDRKQLEVVRKEDRRDLTKISSLVFVDLLILSCKYR